VVQSHPHFSANATAQQRRTDGLEAQALSLGRGGVSLVSRATITRGMRELKNNERLSANRVRHEGGGRKQVTKHQLNLLPSLEGGTNPGRNTQFEFINAQAATFLKQNHPVISVDAKKKERKRWLNRRNEKRPRNREKFHRLIQWYPLPPPRIIHGKHRMFNT